MIKTETVAKTSKPKGKAKAAAAKKPARGKKKSAPKAKPTVEPTPAPKPEPQPKPAEGHKGGNPPKLTEADIARVIEVMRACGGIKTAAAERLNVGRTTLYAFLKEHPAVQEAVDEIDEDIKDLTELKIIQAIRAGEMNTVRWYAEMKMKDRGYVRRVETTGKDGGPVETQQKLDLSKLTDEELEILTKAAERRENGATQG